MYLYTCTFCRELFTFNRIKYCTAIQVLVCCCSFFSSCAFQDEKGEATYPVSSRNFENIVSVSGFVEPVRSSNMTCPRFVEGVVTFLIEDGAFVERGEVVCIIEVKEL